MGAVDRQGDCEWLLARDGERYGPYPFMVLVNAVKKGIVGKDDLVWRSGWNCWRPAQSVAGLFATPEVASRFEVSPLTNTEIADAIKRLKVPYDGQTGNYFARHWRGDLSLPVSYWINGVLVGLASFVLVLLLNAFVESSGTQAGIPIVAALAVFLVAILTLSIWQMVGIWRSASRRVVGGKIFWARMAQLAVIIGVVRLFGDFGSSFLPVFSEHIEIALGDKRFGENRFRLMRNGTELDFAGGINIGTAKEFQRMLDAASEVRVLHLNSPGGRLAEADLIAAEVRKRRLITYVSENCESACTHIFLAGRERWVSERAKLGFHQPSFPGLGREEVVKLIEKERRDLIAMGLPADFVSKALNTPHDEMWRPSQNELLAARAITGVSDGTRFAASGGFSEVEQALLKFPLYAALKRHDPRTFDEVIALFKEEYLRNGSEEEIASSARTLISKVARRNLPFASDTHVLQSVDIIIGYMDGLRTADPESCVALEDDSKGARLKSDLLKQFPEIAAKELTLLQFLIESEAYGTRSIPTAEQVEPYLQKAVGKLEKRSELQLAVLDKAKLTPADYKPFCETVLAFYQEIRRLPTREAVALLRNMFADATN